MKNKIILIGFIIVAYMIARVLNLTTNNTEEVKAFLYFQEQITNYKAMYLENKLIFILLFSSIFYLLTIFFIPFIGPFFVIIAGALLGPLYATLLFSFLVSISYTSSFLIVRTIFIKIHLLRRFNKKFQHIVHGFEKEGWLYLLSVRLAAVIPAIAINIGMGLTRIPSKQFYLATQAGTLPIIAVYAYAGSRINEFKNFNDLISPHFLLIMIILAIIPLFSKIVLDSVQKKIKNQKKSLDK